MARMVRSAAINTVGNALPVLSALVTAPLLALGLGVVGRGEAAAATAPAFLIMAALTFGVPESVTFHISSRRGAARQVLLRALGISVCAGVIGWAALAVAADLLSAGDETLAVMMRWVGVVILPGLIVGVLRGFAAGLQKWGLIAGERATSALVRLLWIAGLAVSGTMTVEAAAFAIGISSVLGVAAYVPLARFRAQAPQPAEGPRVLRFGMGVWVGAVAGVVLSRIDQVLFVPFSTVAQLGLYAVAVAISEVILVFNRAVRDVVFAAESAQNDDERLVLASRLSTIVTLAAAVAVSAVAPLAIPFFFGADFADATSVTIVLLIAIVLGNPGSVAGAGLIARGKPLLRSVSLIGAAVVNVIALIVLLPTLGAMGAAIATVIGNVVAGWTNIVWLRIRFGISPLAFVAFRRSDFILLGKLVTGVIGKRQ